MQNSTAASKCEQVMFEAVAKAAEIILLNRIHSKKRLGRRMGRQRFNMDVEEVDVIRGMMEYWRRDLHLPLRILIVWRDPSSDSKNSKPRLLERWDIQFELGTAALSGPHEEELLAQVRTVWKRVVIMLRTLYSRMLLLPATTLAQEDGKAQKKGSEHYSSQSGSSSSPSLSRQSSIPGAKNGSLAFAVCTRENESDAWLLLNGHESAAYQSNPPLDFNEDARVEKFAFNPATCAFGTYSIYLHYDTTATELSVAYQSFDSPFAQDDKEESKLSRSSSESTPKQQSIPTDTIDTPDNMRRSPSGISILLAKENGNKANQIDDWEEAEEEAEQNTIHVPPPDTSFDHQDIDSADLKRAKYQRTYSSSYAPRSIPSLSSTPEDEAISPPLLHPPAPSVESSPGAMSQTSFGCRFSPRRLLHTASATLARPPRSSLSGRSVSVSHSGGRGSTLVNASTKRPPRQPGLSRHISRSADDDPGKKMLEARAAAREDGINKRRDQLVTNSRWQHLNAPFGYADDDDDPSLFLDAPVVHTYDETANDQDKGRTSPIVFAKQAVKPLTRSSDSASNYIQEHNELFSLAHEAPLSTQSNIPATLPPAVMMGSLRGSGGEMIESRSHSYYGTTPETPDKQFSAPPPFAYPISGNSPDAAGSVPEARTFANLLGSSPPFAAALAGAVWGSRKNSTEKSDASAKASRKQPLLVPQTNTDTEDPEDSDDDDGAGAYFLAQGQSGLPSARGAMALTADSSPFSMKQPLRVDPFDDFQFSALDSDDDEEIFEEGKKSTEEKLSFYMSPDEPLPPFAFDDDEDLSRISSLISGSNISASYLSTRGSNENATVVDAVVEILHVCTEPPNLAFDKEQPLTWQRLDHDLAKCSRIREANKKQDLSNQSSSLPQAA